MKWPTFEMMRNPIQSLMSGSWRSSIHLHPLLHRQSATFLFSKWLQMTWWGPCGVLRKRPYSIRCTPRSDPPLSRTVCLTRRKMKCGHCCYIVPCSCRKKMKRLEYERLRNQSIANQEEEDNSFSYDLTSSMHSTEPLDVKCINVTKRILHNA